MNPAVRVEMRGATALVTLNRPDARNAIDNELRAEFAAVVARMRDDDAVRSVVITGAGKAFCGGGDLRALVEADLDAGASRERIRRMHLWFEDWVNLEKPVIAAVNGAAFGSGFSMAMASDFILCSPYAKFCAVFARIGVAPDLGALAMLPRLVGLQKAKELCFSAREVSPSEAVALGLVYAVRPAETLVDDALALAQSLNSGSPEAFASTKAILNQSQHLDRHILAELEAGAQAIAFTSRYFKESARRFLGKEPPQFTWDVPFPPGDLPR